MTGRYCLSVHLDSASAPIVASDLLERRGQPLCVDASKVEFAGALGLQVLVSAERQWRLDGHAFRIDPLSARFKEAAEGLGVPLEDLGASPEAQA